MEGVGRKSDRQSVRQSSSARATHAHTRTHTRTHTDTRAPTHTDTRAHTLQVRITEEFFRQGDLERALAMPVTPVRACRPVNPLRNSARKKSLQMAHGIRSPTRCDILPPEAVVSGYLLVSGTHSPEDSRRILTGGGFGRRSATASRPRGWACSAASAPSSRRCTPASPASSPPSPPSPPGSRPRAPPGRRAARRPTPSWTAKRLRCPGRNAGRLCGMSPTGARQVTAPAPGRPGVRAAVTEAASAFAERRCDDGAATTF